MRVCKGIDTEQCVSQWTVGHLLVHGDIATFFQVTKLQKKMQKGSDKFAFHD